MTGARVELDTSDLVRGVKQLSSELKGASVTVGRRQAETTARAIRAGVPVLTGRLRGTVSTRILTDGAAVTYGGNLPYAGYIEGRSHAVEDALDGADTDFSQAMHTAAEKEVRRL